MWKKLNIESKDIIDRYTKNKFQINDLIFTNLYLWSVGENIEYKIEDEILLIRGYYKGKIYYYMPLALDESEESIQKIVQKIKKIKENNHPIGYIDEHYYEKLKHYINFEESTDSFDYIYLVEDLAFLKGRKYSNKRNRINVFEKNYSYTYEKINEENINDVINFQKNWYKSINSENFEVLENECKGILKILENFSKLNCKGGLIRVGNDIVAYTIGELLSDDMLVIHIEKALIEYVGSYQIINSLFLKNEFSNIKYVNREDDFGDEGLREAKMSYHPIKFLKKYHAV